MRRRAVRGVRGGMGRGLERVLAQVRREVLFEDVLVRLVPDPSARGEDELVRTVAVGDLRLGELFVVRIRQVLVHDLETLLVRRLAITLEILPLVRRRRLATRESLALLAADVVGVGRPEVVKVGEVEALGFGVVGKLAVRLNEYDGQFRIGEKRRRERTLDFM